jgi:hypothetical protein
MATRAASVAASKVLLKETCKSHDIEPMEVAMTPWNIQADEFVTCNCDYGCPCQFNAPPTNGDCQAVAGLAIKKGHFGDVTLDGMRAVGAMRWPGAIHEGNGEAFWIIDERADEAQRDALLTILSGQETEPFATVWNVFASTLKTVHEPIFEPIDIAVDVEGRTGHVKVNGLIETAGEPIRNPISGDEHRVRIDLIGGFEYETAEVGSGTAKTNGPIKMSWDGAYAQLAHIHLNNNGIVSERSAA